MGSPLVVEAYSSITKKWFKASLLCKFVSKGKFLSIFLDSRRHKKSLSSGCAVFWWDNKVL